MAKCLDFDLDGPPIQETSFNEEEDDTDYDALNNETFGEDSIPCSNWEEIHEKLTSELQNFDEANSELSKRIASFILDDEDPPPAHLNAPPALSNTLYWDNGKEASQGNVPPKAPPLVQEASPDHKASNPVLQGWWGEYRGSPPRPTRHHSLLKQPHPPPSQIITLQELETALREDADSMNTSKPATRASVYGGERGRNLPPNMRRNHRANGNYQRFDRGGAPPMASPRGRFARGRLTPNGMPGAFHGAHHPSYAPFDVYAHQRPHGMPRHPGHPMVPRPILGARYPPPPQHDHHFAGPSGIRRPPPFRGQLNREPYGNFSNQQGGYGHVEHPIPSDEYAGLMEPHEKQWLYNIQMAHLNSNQPIEDDYYYLMYLQTRQGNSTRKVGNHSMKNNRDATVAKPAAQSTYKPLQFENSLGKLQIGSVTAPRKIIDMETVEPPENNTKYSDKKFKQILMEIEELHKPIMEMEDVLSINSLSSVFRSTSGAKKKEIDMMATQEKIVTTIIRGKKLVTYLSIRKGKKLVLRLLHILYNPSPLIQKLLKDLVPVTRKNTGQLLLSFLPAIRIYLSTASLNTLVEFTQHYDISFLLPNKFAISVIANMVERAEQVLPECHDNNVIQNWIKILQRMAESTQNWAETERPVVGVDRSTLTRHLMLITDVVPEEQVNALIRALSTLQSTTPAPGPTD